MSKEKEDTGFGFKDGDKARETIKLLEQHDLNYRRLTVRGLLGRAKRVLTMTKAEEKIKNIKDAIKIFEEWVEENKAEPKGGKKNEDQKKSENKEEKEKKSGEDECKEKERDDNKADTVPGCGFKDKEKALDTIKVLDGRDPDYQKLAVKGLIGRAKRVLTSTRDEEKLKNINDAITVFDDFLDEFERANLGSQTLKYLPLETVEEFAAHADDVSERQKRFLKAYKEASGNYKRLRTVEDEDEVTWDIVRNKELKILTGDKSKELFTDDGKPTKNHLNQIFWAYSPRPDKLKEATSRKRKSDVEDNQAKKTKA